jgi:LAO/AO transport system kinase
MSLDASTAVKVEALAQDVRAGRRAALARAITLVESVRASDRPAADALVAALMPCHDDASAKTSHRVGITGVPGVGKSAFIETMGTKLTARGHRVAVLAVDPSSVRSGGSILGDKTRMTALSRDPNAFIRPSPAAGALGGVARRTRETIIVCEAAGFDVVMVETVGVGQSEVMVADMVDFVLVLVLAGGGDELQGMKRGIFELADAIAVTKADGDNVAAAEIARQELAAALRYMRPRADGWAPEARTCSSLTGSGLDEIWNAVVGHRAMLEASGGWVARRQEQHLRWMWAAVEQGVLAAFAADPAVAAVLARLEAEVRRGTIGPDRAAADLLQAFGIPAGGDPSEPLAGRVEET